MDMKLTLVLRYARECLAYLIRRVIMIIILYCIVHNNNSDNQPTPYELCVD